VNRPPSVRAGHAAPAPIIQIFGFNDCQDTRKAQRFFAERRLTVHFVNMKERPPSKGELRRFVEKLGAPALIDKDGPRYRALGLHVSGDSPQRVLARAETEPRLLRTPLVRYAHHVAIGHAPAEWQAWIDATKGGH